MANNLISFSADFDEVEKALTRLERKQLPFAKRLTVKNTAVHIARKTLPRIMPKVFDRPTRWTLNAFYGYQPRGKDAIAYVNIKDGGSTRPGRGGRIGTPAFKYLRTQIKGGKRQSAKGHELKLRALNILWADEYTVPGKDMRLNRFGNITAKTYSKILADVQGSDVGIAQGFGQATTTEGKKRYFYHPNLRPRCIYEGSGFSDFSSIVVDPQINRRFRSPF